MRPTLRAVRSWVASAGAAVVALGAIGWLPTARWGGEAATRALVAGCAASLAAAALGAVPVLRAVAAGGAAKPHATAGWSMALRAGGTLVGALWLALATELPRRPLLTWVAIAYGVLLVIETRWTVRWLPAGGRRAEKTENGFAR